MEKYRFKPFGQYAEASPLNLEKLNSIRSLYYAYQESGLPAEEIALDFYRGVGCLLMGLHLEDLELKYVEFER